MTEQTDQGFLDLVRGIRHYQAGDLQAAEANWRRWTSREPSLVDIFARSLLSNLASRPGDARGSYEPKQLRRSGRYLDVFDQLSRLSFVNCARTLAAAAHAATVLPNTTHIELGIGNGQHAELLVKAAQGKVTRVIGIDVDPLKVEVSRLRFEKRGIQFFGLVEPLDFLDWASLYRLVGSSHVSVNATFALHQLSLEGKRRVLCEVARLSPRLFTLAETSAEHWQADLLSRFINCYTHFRAVDGAIVSAEVDAEARGLLLEFFGREIADILRDTSRRSQRHEQWLFWYRELLAGELVPYSLKDRIAEVCDGASQLDAPGPGVVNVSSHSAHLVSVFAFGTGSWDLVPLSRGRRVAVTGP